MSHPDHELAPTEHQLSQDVLEFLIAHQDWFMLDTPPPPPSRSHTPPYDASARTSVSDGEGPDGWRIIQRHQRSADDRGRHNNNNKGEQRASPQPSTSATPGIMRSRTLPSSSRKGRPSTADGGGGGGGGRPATSGGAKPAAGGVSPAVLRKSRRASAQPS